ncbi:hypothetical protein HMPREF9248_0534 [Fannyhessea vaginae PB189-T1-4]|uniref:Uncharacterized protein n=1 Tax=Fannyhessea vaginae PB189-T1-4 TaxID=866774 RepID=A0ABP2IYN3_9ACTN|nr:hypothetical protein HMPREF9248_0534 [Fannyhessea vaginae PB189-T1-4]
MNYGVKMQLKDIALNSDGDDVYSHNEMRKTRKKCTRIKDAQETCVA